MNEKRHPKEPLRRNHQIFAAVRALLVAGKLPVGLVLTESSLARLFNVSRAPASEALAWLENENLVFRFQGRGYMVGTSEREPVRTPLEDTPLAEAAQRTGPLDTRNWREILYPQVETIVAGCMSYGTFTMSGVALSRHLGVSRTTSNEILSRLERVGLVEQAPNGRWIVPRMTETGVHHHYQIRSLLEPAALEDVMADPDPGIVAAALKRIEDARLKKHHDFDTISAIERDLHGTLVQSCPNPQMRDTIHRSQLPLIASHMALARYDNPEEMLRVLDDHQDILETLASGRVAETKDQMRRHLLQGERTTIAYISRRPEPPEGVVPPYLSRME
ncbi:GntR family transcriptional regulator [Oceaniglobus trochenteri]|uniref:GntR family transcriptional regulator n=1 Tax=Oceaniglobus trochenteri TaxID=2763260 RepID=UPI001CFFDE42|nr:GntR family transcriptional regulator [Oceaniglobus trochenteri]